MLTVDDLQLLVLIIFSIYTRMLIQHPTLFDTLSRKWRVMLFQHAHSIFLISKKLGDFNLNSQYMNDLTIRSPNFLVSRDFSLIKEYPAVCKIC